jgi:hypothetical protein
LGMCSKRWLLEGEAAGGVCTGRHAVISLLPCKDAAAERDLNKCQNWI